MDYISLSRRQRNRPTISQVEPFTLYFAKIVDTATNIMHQPGKIRIYIKLYLKYNVILETNLDNISIASYLIIIAFFMK